MCTGVCGAHESAKALWNEWVKKKYIYVCDSKFMQISLSTRIRKQQQATILWNKSKNRYDAKKAGAQIRHLIF